MTGAPSVILPLVSNPGAEHIGCRAWREHDVQHKEYGQPRSGRDEPNRRRPRTDFPVFSKIRFEGKNKGNDSEDSSDGREDGMCLQEDLVRKLVLGRPSECGVAVNERLQHITDKEQRGEHRAREHEAFVRFHSALADQVPADGHGNCTQNNECLIDIWQGLCQIDHPFPGRDQLLFSRILPAAHWKPQTNANKPPVKSRSA
jgi:hypothetical protein